MSANLRQIKETSRIVGYTARPTPGEAASPWQAICTVQHDNLMGPPSRGGRIQFRMASGMYHPCLSVQAQSTSVASHRRPALEGTNPRTHTPALQRRNTLRATLKATYEGRATEQCGLTPTPSVCTALSLEQAPTGQFKQSRSLVSWLPVRGHRRALGLDVSLPFRHVTMRDWILPPRGLFAFLGGGRERTLHIGQSCQ